MRRSELAVGAAACLGLALLKWLAPPGAAQTFSLVLGIVFLVGLIYTLRRRA